MYNIISYNTTTTIEAELRLLVKSTENSGLNVEQIRVLKSVSGHKFVCEIWV